MEIRKLIKNKISDLFFYYSQLQKDASIGCRILMYHSIEESNSRLDKLGLAVPPETFYAQMKYLKESGFNVISILELVDKIKNKLPLSTGSIAITFDDGYRSIFTNAYAALKEFGFAATLFINIDFIENRVKDGQCWSSWPALSWQEVDQLSGAGGLSIGSHALSHVRLGELGVQQARHQILESKRIIEDNIKEKVWAFSYPHGSFNGKIKRILQEGGFSCACSSVEGISNLSSDIFALKRTEITSGDGIIGFKKKISGSHDWIGCLR